MFRMLALLFMARALVLAQTLPMLPAYEDSILKAREAEAKGLMGKALKELDVAEKLNSNRLDSYFLRGRIALQMRKPEAAATAFSRVIEIDPKASTAYNLRGMERFKLGQVEKSVEDFDRYLELEPQQRPYHWQRGIALYLAGKYDDGKKQFETHQTVNSQDVENAVFHFICVARAESFEKARAGLIEIREDRRVPMMDVFNLFAGKGTVDDVWKAVQGGAPAPKELENRTFFAHYYLGLYYEAKGDPKQAYEHLKLAATDFAQDHYMGDVAKVHFQRLLK